MFVLFFILFILFLFLCVFVVYKYLEIEKDIETLYNTYAQELEKLTLLNLEWRKNNV